MDDLLKYGYEREGYLYCINANITVKECQVVKIGKIGMKMGDSEIEVENKLSRRYSTYYPEHNLLHFQRVINCHDAEKYLFKILNDLKYKRELFYYDKEKISKAFEMTKEKFPDIENLINNITENELTKINVCIRERIIE